MSGVMFAVVEALVRGSTSTSSTGAEVVALMPHFLGGDGPFWFC